MFELILIYRNLPKLPKINFVSIVHKAACIATYDCIVERQEIRLGKAYFCSEGGVDDGFAGSAGWLSRRAFETNPIGKAKAYFSSDEWMMVGFGSAWLISRRAFETNPIGKGFSRRAFETNPIDKGLFLFLQECS
jgi:hypothetical protein